jgi:Lrp/AsnC family transcriptional regulator, leucine-responsive regulatory protein
MWDNMPIDKTDKKILELLQNNGKISNQTLADNVALSPSPCLRRVKQLEDEGYIQRYVALLDHDKIGLGLTVIVLVGMSTHNPKLLNHFESVIKSLHEVVQCYLIAGQDQDYILKVIVPNLDAYQIFLMKKLTQIEGVRNIHSSFVLHRVVDKTALPLNQL